MEVIVNRCWGGAKLSDEVAKELKVSKYDFCRDDYYVIKAVKENPERASGKFSKLKVIQIPDETTDYMIKDYDGMETVIYVVGGKLYEA